MISISYFPTALIWMAIGLVISLGTNLISGRFTFIARRYWVIGYRIIIPYIALLTGAISPYLMGLSNINWATSLGIGTGLSFAILLVLALINITLLNRQHNSHQEQHSLSKSSYASPHVPTSSRGLIDKAIWALSEQFYWTFIRAAIWELLIRFEPEFELPAYHALWIAALIALPDTLMHTKNQYNRMSNVCIFIATSILFFFTRNFWLCACLHLAMSFILRQASLEQLATTAKSQTQSLPQIEGRTQ